MIKLLSETQVYAGRLKNRDELIKSSSGGAFTALSDYFLNNGNGVVCSVYNYNNHRHEYRILETVEERNLARGSIYVQSIPGDVFRLSEEWLKNNPDKSLLFVGMGCQADGFRQFSEQKGFRDRVCIVDIICHGSPSPMLWKDYVRHLETQKGKIEYLTFKDKRNGWRTPTAFAKISGQDISIANYVNIFYNHCALRPSCYKCPYAKTERNTDITIGDFWHIEETIPDFYDTSGNSVFLIHTDKGENVFEQIKNILEYRLSDTVQCRQDNLIAPTKRSPHRERFWKDYQSKGIDYVIKKYGNAGLKHNIKNMLGGVKRRIKKIFNK